MTRSRRVPLSHLLIAAALLLLVLALRAHNVLAMPAFNDESLHVRRSEIVWTFENPATSFTAGKLMAYYWLGLFKFDRLHVLHGGRLVFALFILLGAAGTYRAGRSLFNHAVGALALLLYAFAPFLVFYERFILADQMAAAFGMLAVWAGVRLARHPTRRNGLLSGLCVSLAILAKLTAAPFAVVSLVAIWTLGKRDAQPPTGSGWRDRLARIVPRRYWPALLVAYGFNAISGLPFILFPLFREAADEPVLLVGENLFVSSGFLTTFADNVPQLWAALTAYFGLVTVLVTLALIARLLIRARGPALYLITCTLLPWLLILPLSPDPSNRYWVPGMPPLLVLAAAALWGGSAVIARWVQTLRRGDPGDYSFLHRLPVAPLIALTAVLLWIAAVAAPFVRHAWHNPLEMRLPDHDKWEYFQNFASGYGLVEASRVMPTLPPSKTSGRVPVVGLVGSCHQLRLYLDEDGPVDLSCPFFGWDGEYMEAVIQHIERRLDEETVVYTLTEPELRFTDLTVIPVRWELIERFPRPWNGMVVELHQVQRADDPFVTASVLPR